MNTIKLKDGYTVNLTRGYQVDVFRNGKLIGSDFSVGNKDNAIETAKELKNDFLKEIASRVIETVVIDE